MSWNLVHLKDTPSMPWKNGGGTTRELVTWPNAQHWVWRLSVAEVALSGPFSSFAEVHRWFAVLTGAGVQLTVDQHPHVLHAETPPLDFPGNATVDCQLVNGATQDFNLMVKQGVSARMDRISGSCKHTLMTSKVIAVYAGAKGASVQVGAEVLAVDANALTWQRLPAGSQVHVFAENALWMEIDV